MHMNRVFDSINDVLLPNEFDLSKNKGIGYSATIYFVTI